jgi:hypothetical protein
MNLTFMEMTDKGLAGMRDLQDTIGREARKEIKRRQLIGYADGTMFGTAKAQVETESRVGTTKVVMPVARKVEKKMAGRGR